MPSSRAIQLSPSSTRYVDGSVDGFRLTVVATAAVGMPTAVFAYLAGPPQPGQTEGLATFDHVCSPTDLAEYPEGTPADGAVPPWFRVASVDLVFRSRSLAEEALTALVEQVGALRDALDRVDDLGALTPVWLGTPPG